MFRSLRIDGLFQMADHLEALVAARKSAKPGVGRIGARTAYSQPESLAAAFFLAVAKSDVLNVASRTSVADTDLIADSNKLRSSSRSSSSMF